MKCFFFSPRGIIWAFLFSWILMMIVIVLFLSGGLLYTEGCRHFVNLGETEESQVYFVTHEIQLINVISINFWSYFFS